MLLVPTIIHSKLLDVWGNILESLSRQAEGDDYGRKSMNFGSESFKLKSQHSSFYSNKGKN